jgi:rhamnulokinase
MPAYASVDLGAESGRVLRGDFEDGRLTITQTARFKTGTKEIDGHLRWDLPRFLNEIEAGLRAAAEDGPLASIGVDTFGVDFGLLGPDEKLLALPVAYRDARTEGMAERFFERVPAAEIYGRTGIQHLPFNSLYQLFALSEANDPTLAAARHLLMIPDLVHRHLSGIRVTEKTNASTTACLSLETGTWDEDLLAAAGVDPSLMPEIVPPGTVLGAVRPELGLGNAKVIAPATHDTACAVAATPGEGEDWAYLSSGTWSLLGVETGAPVVTEQARERNFTNEAGVDETTRLLKNVSGLWLLQRFRQDLGEGVSYADLLSLARRSPPGGSLIDPDDVTFLKPTSMTEAFVAHLKATGQAIPETLGAFVRMILESLALRYQAVLEDLVRLTGRDIRRLHVVGGGAKNALLSQLTADATDLPVLAGPAEATAIGNLLLQARAMGDLGSLPELREVVERSFPVTVFEPRGERS